MWYIIMLTKYSTVGVLVMTCVILRYLRRALYKCLMERYMPQRVPTMSPYLWRRSCLKEGGLSGECSIQYA